MDAAERVRTIVAMRAISGWFYSQAVKTGNHPFIEFTGLLNEYIKACEQAHDQGIDFSQCTKHSGQPLPLDPHMVRYINEKLECIFTGRSVIQET